MKRPVPLEHQIYALSQFHVVKEKDAPFLQNEYQFFINNIEKAKELEKLDIREIKAKLKEEKQQKGTYNDKSRQQKKQTYMIHQINKKFIKNVNVKDLSDPNHSNQELGVRQLIRHCQKEKMLPIVIFCFSKAKIIELSQKMLSFDLNTKNETGKITAFFNNALKKLKPTDRELPQFLNLKYMLDRGYAMHHGDLLPLAKEIVEILFAEGLVKVLFATETFAMGVNMPAKTVIFFGVQKNDGISFRYLKSSEYTQMSGRAGRRGLDEKGNVIIYIQDVRQLPEANDMKQIIDTKGEQLESKFRLTYAIILNLLTAQDIDVMEMMKRSFGENQKFSQLPRIKEKIKNLKKELDYTYQIECEFVSKDDPKPIEDFFKTDQSIRDMSRQIYQDQQFLSKIFFPKFALIQGIDQQIQLGVLLKLHTSQKENNFDDPIMFKALIVSKLSNQKLILAYEKKTKIEHTKQLQKDFQYGYRIVDLRGSEVFEIYSDKLDQKTTSSDIINESRTLQDIAEDLKNRIENGYGKKKLTIMNVKGQSYLGDLFQNRDIQKQVKTSSKCTDCNKCIDHFQLLERREQIHKEMKSLIKETDEEDLCLIDDFEARKEILRRLNYIDDENHALIKARIAREISESEIYLCEVLMENVLDELSPACLGAVLSGFVCQWRSRKKTDHNEEQDLPDELFDAMDKVEEIISKIVTLEHEKHLLVGQDIEKVIEQRINFSHTKIVYEWIQQREFLEVCAMTDCQEGVIVKTIQRLEILLRDVKNAAKIMGNLQLVTKLDEISQSIKRDIVFASSLYLEN